MNEKDVDLTLCVSIVGSERTLDFQLSPFQKKPSQSPSQGQGRSGLPPSSVPPPTRWKTFGRSINFADTVEYVNDSSHDETSDETANNTNNSDSTSNSNSTEVRVGCFPLMEGIDLIFIALCVFWQERRGAGTFGQR